MKSQEILDKIEKLIDNKIDNSDNVKTDSNKNIVEDIAYLTLQFILNVIKTPFNVVAKYLKDEIIISIKKDARLYALVMGIMGVLFVFFSVIWLFISVAVGVYFYEQGYSILISIVYSILFQIVSFILVSLIAFVASRKLKSLKIMKKLSKHIN
jgi:hypothetical protein